MAARIVVTEFVSLDGVMEAPGGEPEFKYPNWTFEFDDKFNAMPKFVVSTTLKDPEWNNTTVLDSGDATAQVRKLKEEFDGELQVPGSHRLVQELIESDLVDQINLMVFPVLLGTGQT